MKRIAAAMAEDNTQVIEIDDITSSYTFDGTKTISEDKDVFLSKVDISKQTKKVKNKFYKLSKRYQTGADGTESKYVDPELVNGYGMFDLVQPPYNMEILASLYEESSVHNASVLARAMNTVALGWRWEDTSKTRKRIERATLKEGESLPRLRDELQKEEDRLEELFDSFNIDEDFKNMLDNGNKYNIGYHPIKTNQTIL
jgi:hypothetical protein